MSDYIRHRKSPEAKSKKLKTAITNASGKEAGFAEVDSDSLAAVKQRMACMIQELHNQLAIVRESNPSFAAPVAVSLQGGGPCSTTSCTLSMTASSNARQQ